MSVRAYWHCHACFFDWTTEFDWEQVECPACTSDFIQRNEIAEHDDLYNDPEEDSEDDDDEPQHAVAEEIYRHVFQALQSGLRAIEPRLLTDGQVTMIIDNVLSPNHGDQDMVSIGQRMAQEFQRFLPSITAQFDNGVVSITRVPTNDESSEPDQQPAAPSSNQRLESIGRRLAEHLFGQLQDPLTLAFRQSLADDLTVECPMDVQAVNDLPRTIYTSGNDTSCCGICLMEYVDNDKIITLDCDHYFHDECILPWLAHHNTCPTCRKCFKVAQEITTVPTGNDSSGTNGSDSESDSFDCDCSSCTRE